MKNKKINILILTLLLTTGIAFCTTSSTSETRSAIGIRLDSTPLPALLVKHLGLTEGQGIRIANVLKDSAADEAGLERDDIVIGFQGKDIVDAASLTNEVRQIGIGKEVPIEIIHLGQRKTVTLKLKAVITGTPNWKYPDEPQVEKFFQPGRVFRIAPGGQDMIQMFDNQIPDDIKSNIEAVFNEIYSSTSIINGKTYSVTIEGNPNDKDSMITVKIDKNSHETTIGEIDEMPDEYQEAAKNAIEKAKQKGTNSFPMFFDDIGNNIRPNIQPNIPSMNNPNISGNQIFRQMEEQMKLMQKQFMELEKSHQKLLEQLNQDKQ